MDAVSGSNISLNDKDTDCAVFPDRLDILNEQRKVFRNLEPIILNLQKKEVTYYAKCKML